MADPSQSNESKTLGSVKMAAAGGKEDVGKMAAAGGKEEARCTLFDCFCCWRRFCTPRIPRVAPGRDYVCIPAGADDHHAWSLLVGSLSSSGSPISDSVLRLHEFHVARSGRVLGWSDDALEVRHSVETKGGGRFLSASAALTPNGCSICLFSEYVEGKSQFMATPIAQRLGLTYLSTESGTRWESGRPKDKATTISAMPHLPVEPSARCRPVSAVGHVWAPYVCLEDHHSFSLGMHRLDKDASRWEQVGDIFHLPYKMEVPARWAGYFFQGYAVLHDDTILVSLQPSEGLFFTFNFSNGTWTKVTTPKHTKTLYVPIFGRGVCIKEYSSVYFLRDNRIYAYKLCYDQDQDQPKLMLEPPTSIDSVCPFHEEGHGFLTHLGGRLMCSVWINTERPGCSCDHLHVLITTFQLRSQPKGIDILHSTCRRLGVSPVSSGPLSRHEFCILQEYKNEEFMPPRLPPRMLDDPYRSGVIESHVIESSKMLDCCRKFLSGKRSYYEFEEPTVQINKELYLFCEAGSQSIVYVAKIENGRCHDKVLTKKYALIISEKPNRSPPWHLVFSSSSSNVYAVSRGRDHLPIYTLMEEAPQYVRPTKPSWDTFSIVLQVDHKIIAVTDTLQVFYHDQSKSQWVGCCHRADDSLTLYKEGNSTIESKQRLVLKEKSFLSGYAVLGETSFVVSDANSYSILLYDLRYEKWRVLGVASPGTELLNGRCVFVDGFIYSCSRGGISARRLVWHKKCCPMVLRDPIFLHFSWELPWRKSWVAERMCLDCVCADRKKSPNAIIFCVVQGEYCSFRRGSNDVHITTVEVKIKTPCSGRREPERIEHVAIGTCFVEHESGFVWTKSCFAVGT